MADTTTDHSAHGAQSSSNTSVDGFTSATSEVFATAFAVIAVDLRSVGRPDDVIRLIERHARVTWN